MAVPIAVPGGDVLGVFSLWSTEAANFAPHDVDLATDGAHRPGSILVAGS